MPSFHLCKQWKCQPQIWTFHTDLWAKEHHEFTLEIAIAQLRPYTITIQNRKEKKFKTLIAVVYAITSGSTPAEHIFFKICAEGNNPISTGTEILSSVTVEQKVRQRKGISKAQKLFDKGYGSVLAVFFMTCKRIQT